MGKTFKHIFFSAVAIAAFGITSLFASPGTKSSAPQPAPVSFVENKGQVRDLNNKLRTDVQFRLSAANGLNIFVGNGAIHYQFSKNDHPEYTLSVEDRKNHVAERPTTYTMDRMDVELVGANKYAKVITGEKQEYFEKYYTNGNENGATANAYDRITYKEIYPNIDWVLYTSNGLLKHEFVVRAGGRVSDIKLKYGGTKELKLNDDGSLTASTQLGSVTEQAPRTFQRDGKSVTSRFVLNRNVLSYNTGDYTGDLVIDPTLQWATYYGGAGDDQVFATAADAWGNVYITGITASSTGIATTGAFKTTHGGGTRDIFLVKFNAAGVRLWATYYGGTGEDYAYSLATDALGNVFVTGETGSNSSIASSGVHQGFFAGPLRDAFLLKFSGEGARVWATYYGGNGDDYGYGVAVDKSGNVFIAGQTGSNSANSIATTGTHQSTFGGASDAFVAKFNTNGARQWGTYLGGTGIDNGRGVAVDPSGDVFITGMTQSTGGIASPGAHQTTFATGIFDMFLGKFTNASGARQWSTYYGAAGEEVSYAIASDGSGNAYMTGYTNSTSGVATSGTHQTTLGGAYDALLVKFDNAGALQWGTYYGGTSNELPNGLSSDPAGNVYLVASVGSTTGISTFDGTQVSYGGGGSDAALAQFSAAGSLLWATYFGNTASETGSCVATDGIGNVLLGAYTTTSTAMATSGAHQTVSGGGTWEGLLAKYNFCSPPTVAPITGVLNLCPGGTTTLANATPGGTWSSGSASVGTMSGSVFTGLSLGNAVVSYTVTNGCAMAVAKAIVTVGQSNITTVAGTGAVGLTGDGGPATAALLNNPTGVATDLSGNVYIADYGNNKIRRIFTTGVMNTVAGSPTGVAGFGGDGGSAVAALFNGPYSVAMDRGGNMYISDKLNHRIRKVTTAGIISTIAGTSASGFLGEGTPATTARLNEPNQVAADNNGNVYFADLQNHRVRKISNAGIISTVAGTGTGGFTSDGIAATASGLNAPAGVAVDGDGNVYIADGGNHRIRMVNTAGIITTIAGTGTPGFFGEGVAATSAQLNNPMSIVFDAAGNLIIADQANHRVRMINSSGIITTVTGNGTAAFSGDNGMATAGQLNGPYSVAADANGNVYIADFGNNRVRKIGAAYITPITGTMNTCVGVTTTLSVTGSGGNWISSNPAIATVGSTSGIVTGVSTGTLTISYVFSGGCFTTTTFTVNSVPALSPNNGQVIVCPGGSTAMSNPFVDGIWSSSNPLVATVSSTGLVTGVSAGYALISFTATNVCGSSVAKSRMTVGQLNITTIAGNGTAGYSGDGAAATAALLNKPHGVVADGSGNIFIADNSNHVIRKINTAGVISTVAGNGTPAYGGDGIAATSTSLNAPFQVAVDAAGNLYIGDANNHRVRKVSTSGTITTVAGNGTAGFFGDGGAATAGQLNTPCGIAVDGTGNLYICDAGNHCVRKVDAAGVITTFAGTPGSSGIALDGVAATATLFSSPNYVTISPTGNVVITDNGNHKIRSVNATTGIITTLAGSGTGGYIGEGTATSARLFFPGGVCFDDGGNMYIADYSNSRVRMVNPSGIISTIVNNTGTSGYLGDNGAAATARVANAVDVAIDQNGNVIIADYNNNVVRRLAPVAPPISPIVGVSPLCEGSPTLFTNATPSGSWSSSNTAVARVGASSGFVTGTGGGTATISYSVSTGCGVAPVTMPVTVNAFNGGLINGQKNICVGNSVTLTKTQTGGTWSSNNPAVATITSGGLLTGVALGSTAISYTITNGCGTTAATAWITVGNPIITTIGGGGVSITEGIPATAALLSSPTSVYVDAAGNKYITENAAHKVRKIDVAGNITTVAGTGTGGYIGEGVATAVQLWGPASVFGDASGNLYIAEQFGNRIRKIDASGITSTIAGTGTFGVSVNGAVATATTLRNPTGVVVDASGEVYFSEFGGGVVNKITTSGILLRVAGGGSFNADDIAATAAILSAPYGISLDGIGNLYIAAQGQHKVRKVHLASGVITNVAGTGGAGSLGTGGPATAALLNGPTGVYANPYTVYEGESNGSRVAKIDLTSDTINLFAGTGSQAFGGDGGPPTVLGAFVNRAYGITMDNLGNAYIADFANNRIRMVSMVDAPVAAITGGSSVCVGANITLADATPGGFWSSASGGIATVSGTGVVTGVSAGVAVISYSTSNTCGTVAATHTVTVNAAGGYIAGAGGVCIGSSTQYLNAVPGGTWSSSSPVVATVNSSGLVTGISTGTADISYTVTNGCGTFSVSRAIIVGATPIITTIAGTGTFGYGGDGGLAINANVSDAGSVALDAAGNIYLAEFNNNVIRKITNTGIISTLAGTITPGFSGDGAAATAALLSGPRGIAVDAAGNVYFGDVNNHRVRRISTTGIISTVAGNGLPGYIGDGGPATATGVPSPMAVKLDAAGNIYIGTNGDSRIRMVNTAGIISTICGNGSNIYSGEGVPATDATFGGTQNFDVDGAGNIYFGDPLTHRVRKIAAGSRIITTIAGTGVNGYNGDGIAATTADLNGPTGVVVDNWGNVYIADRVNNRVRKVSASGIISTVTGNGTSAYFGDGVAANTGIVSFPSGVALDAGGNLFIADAGNARIREVSAECPCTGAPTAGTAVASVSTGCTTYNSTLSLSGASALPGITYQWHSSPDNSTYSPVAGATTSIYSATISAPIYYRCVVTCITSGLNATTPGIFLDEGFPVVAAISGASSVCLGGNTTLTTTTSGGSWSSTAPSIASVGSGTGIVSGLAAGTATISYTVTNGCGSTAATKVMSVNSLPAITGTPLVCIGLTTTLSNSSSGGAWTSGATGTATVGSGSGIVTGVAAGSANITYTVGACFVSIPVTVNANPASITPGTPVAICVGATSALGNATPGGTWSSGTTSVATVGTGGLVTGVSAGTATISYTTASGCSSIKTVTINITPAAMSPLSAAVCAGSTTTFTNSVGGGTWSSSASGTASVAGGVVTGVSAGTATISYAIGTCFVTAPVTVNALPAAITPPVAPAICVGATTTLADASPGGTWSSGATGIATVGTSGIVTGVSVGTATISYTNTSGCSATRAVTVNVSPAGISPSSTTVCTGNTVTLTDAVGGGVWSSSASGVASVAGGVVTGVTVGTATISYTIGSCFSTAAVTVNLSPNAGAITGPSSICIGTPATFTDPAPGGVWSSSNISVATVSSGGVVSGVSAGSATISYSVTNGCGTVSATAPVTVNSPAVAGTISGLTMMCAGTMTTLVSSAPGGVWSVTNGTASISSTGIVTAIMPGIDTIYYTVSNACGPVSVRHIMTIGLFLSAGTISGPSDVCVGSSITLTDAAPSGVWSASNANATVTTGGIVTGVSGGTVTISYTVTASCGLASATHVVTVTPIPDAGVISGPMILCAGMTGIYTTTGTGGVWGVTNPTATITSGGVATAVSVGADTITYTVVNACGISTAMTGLSLGAGISAGSISGPSNVCEGASVTLTNPTTGGTWSASNTNATVSAGGVVSGVTAGAVTISYTVTSSCGSVSATAMLTVDPLPNAGTITGASVVCVGSTITLADAAPGGVWSASNGNATVSTGGVVTGVTAGTVDISYTVTTACGTASAISTITVSNAPSAGTITGPGTVCESATITLADATPGGTWSASNTNATVSTGGVVTGVAAGTVTISYTVSGSCGTASATTLITVDPLPNAGAISGPTDVCVASTITLTDPVSGGTWSASNANATVSGGVVTGVTAGTVTISYTVTNGCGTASAISIATVNPLPDAGAITGGSNVCTGSMLVLTSTAPGGVWSASNSNATVSGGIVTGVMAGMDTISYTVSNSCGIATASVVVTIGAVPTVAAITGPSSVCKTASISLANATAGGVWTASNARATVSATGLVTGVTAGADTIRYTVTNACGAASAMKIITIMQAPSPGTISGASSVCVGLTISLSDAAPGGTWSSSNPTIASVSAAGMVSGLSPGTATINYTVSNSCGSRSATHTVAVLSHADCNVLVNGPGSQPRSELKVYPNPNQGSFNMNLLSDNDEPVTVVITNIIGVKIKEFTTTTNKVNDIRLNTAPGIYLLTALTSDTRYITKVTVE